MSIASEISRLQQAKEDLKTSIENKGVTVPSATTIDGYSALVDQISSGGGGASNFVTGTFTFSLDSASPQTVTLDYSGAGYPIAWLFVLNDGVKDATYTSTIARCAIAQIVGTKTYPLQTPTYSTRGESNQAAILSQYKSSTSNASSITSVATLTSNIFSSSAANDSTSTCIRFNSKTSLSVFAGAPSGTTRYGFLNGLTYRYWIIYSS